MVLRRGLFASVSVAAIGAVVWLGFRPPPPETRVMAATKAPRSGETAERAGDRAHGSDPTGTSPDSDDRPHAFRLPSGNAPSLSCESAKMIVAQVRRNLAYAPDAVAPHAFAQATADWLDPYGLWSVAPDAPLSGAIDRHAPELLSDLENRASGLCAAAHALGHAMVAWIGELRAQLERVRATAAPIEGGAAFLAASDVVFEGSSVTRPARALTETLALKLRATEHALGDDGARLVSVATDRYLPRIDDDAWAEIVLAAAVRAYVPLVDPHGAWAPLDEEASVYEVDLEAKPPGRLWDKSTRTAIGLRVDSGAAAPLKSGDVVLAIAGVPTGGMPLEQLEQLGYAASEQAQQRGATPLLVLRAGEHKPRALSLEREHARASDPDPSGPTDAPTPAAAGDDGIEVERVAFGNADALIVPIHDVRDDLGELLTRALLKERQVEDRPIAGVVIDLRGNGGGSTDGAIDALGLFLPGAPLFPMKRRDGTLETDRAPEPPNVDRWNGPVAALVDGDTASAAEMIAGALAAYRRGPVLGSSTFGKGCAQEYLDDAARTGVLRLTTLLYALPDGSPVQRVGLSPSIKLPFGAQAGLSRDREALLPHAPPTWRGPDVRDRSLLAHGDESTWFGAWPPHGGAVGPCKDPDICRALRALGAPAPHRVGKRP